MSKFIIKTVILQEMVSRAIKGAGQNKLIPITSLMAIEVKEEHLTLRTTDASNTLYIMHDVPGAEDFYCVVQAEQFSKLVAKMTSENIILEISGMSLAVTGNGNYKIELPPDENGNMIQYPDPVAEAALDGQATEISLATIKTILNTNKAALAVTMEDPVYTGYYVGDRVVSTDSYKVCGLDVKLFDEPVLMFPETMDLLNVMTEEKISVLQNDEVIEFFTKDCIVFGYKMEGIEDFAINEIGALLDEEFKCSCKVGKPDLLALLDRISLFVGVYDDHAITLLFTDTGINVSSKQSDGVEIIPYVSSKNPAFYTCQVAVDVLIQQIKANSADVIELQYGNDRSIKIVDGNVTQVIALYQEATE